MDVLVSENVAGPAMDALRRDWDVSFEPELWRDRQQLTRRIAGARALVVRNQTRVTAEVLDAAGRLEIVGRAGAGLDNIDVEAASRAGVVVTYAPHENSVSVAELTIGLMLALARKIPAADRDTRGGGWDRRTFTGIELAGKTLGVIGFGRIGRLVAERARGLGMQIVAHDPFLDPAAGNLTALAARSLELNELLDQSDVVTIHVPLTADTVGLLNDERCSLIKSHALLINTSRGEVVDEDAIVRALGTGRLAGAALDVRQCEPPLRGVLEEMPNVILTPHIAAFTNEAQDRVVAAVCRDVAAVLRGDEACGSFNFARPRPRGPQ